MSLGISAATWAGIGAVGGIGASLYGASKQASANKDAQAQNAESQKAVNDSAWAAWLMSKGVQPNSPVSAGTMPTAGNYTAINTRLPVWATLNQTVSPTGAVSLAPSTTPVAAAPRRATSGVPQFVRKTG